MCVCKHMGLTSGVTIPALARRQAVEPASCNARPGGDGVAGGVAYNVCTGCLIIIKQDKLVAQQGQWHNNQTN